MDIDTGIELQKLTDTGRFICEVLGRRTQSKAALAIAASKN